jgi:hypothetical protein
MFLSVCMKGLPTLLVPTFRTHAAVVDGHSVVDDLKPHRRAVKLMVRIAAGLVTFAIHIPVNACCMVAPPMPFK